MTSTCGSSCGWIAAAASCLCFGSFGVPIKGDAASRVDIDALVMQTYKTAVCFLTSWIVLLLGVPFSYTPWGIVSGLFWVPSGTAAIYAIRNAGLAVSQGTWSALIVLVSFTWGVVVFGEKVKSKVGAALGVGLMMIGLWGMSYYSSPDTNRGAEYSDLDTSIHQDDSYHDNYYDEVASSSSSGSTIELPPTEDAPRSKDVVEALPQETGDVSTSSSTQHQTAHVDFLGCTWSRRRLGLACACFNGLWGGSIMVPMHYSSGNTSGLGYAISFAIGASIVCLIMWALRLFHHCRRTRSWTAGYAALPSFHLRVMWIPGGIAGLLWSLGNICSMLSVQYLGEGVGYSVVQASMMVSGLWGIFFFKEVSGTRTRMRWLGAALLTIIGVLLLSYEHRNGE